MIKLHFNAVSLKYVLCTKYEDRQKTLQNITNHQGYITYHLLTVRKVLQFVGNRKYSDFNKTGIQENMMKKTFKDAEINAYFHPVSC